MNQNAGSALGGLFSVDNRGRRIARRHSRLPVAEVRGEVVHWKSRSLFEGPMLRYRPKHVLVGSSFFREGSPLRIAHDAATCAFFNAREFPSRNQRGRRGSGVPTLRSHKVGKIQARSEERRVGKEGRYRRTR